MSKTIGHVNQSGTPGLNAFVDDINYFRVDARRRLDAKRRAELGQLFTSPSLGRLMTPMFEARSQNVRLLDAGTGVGSLSAAFVAEALGWRKSPKEISVSAYEIDQIVLEYLVAE
jgi:adenine-specific DNA-methyltransferase